MDLGEDDYWNAREEGDEEGEEDEADGKQGGRKSKKGADDKSKGAGRDCMGCPTKHGDRLAQTSMHLAARGDVHTLVCQCAHALQTEWYMPGHLMILLRYHCNNAPDLHGLLFRT